jgi:hypothetical protein
MLCTAQSWDYHEVIIDHVNVIRKGHVFLIDSLPMEKGGRLSLRRWGTWAQGMRGKITNMNLRVSDGQVTVCLTFILIVMSPRPAKEAKEDR